MDLAAGDEELLGQEGDADVDMILEAVNVLGVVGGQADRVDIPLLPAAQDYSRKGNSIFADGLKCGTINYFFHWAPETVSATCTCHPECYVTAPIDKIDELELVQWLQSGPRCGSAEDHLRLKPLNTYNRRRG